MFVGRRCEQRLLYFPGKVAPQMRRLKRVLVEPEADRVLWLHVSVLLVLGQGKPSSTRVGPSQWPAN